MLREKKYNLLLYAWWSDAWTKQLWWRRLRWSRMKIVSLRKDPPIARNRITFSSWISKENKNPRNHFRMKQMQKISKVFCLLWFVRLPVWVYSCSGNQIGYLKQYIRQLKKRQIEADVCEVEARETPIYRYRGKLSVHTHIDRDVLSRAKENRFRFCLLFSFFKWHEKNIFPICRFFALGHLWHSHSKRPRWLYTDYG